MTRRSRLTASEIEVGLPVVLVGATEGVPVHRSSCPTPDAWLQHGHPGRIKCWYGEDHVVVAGTWSVPLWHPR